MSRLISPKVIVLALALVGCSPQSRLDRLIAHHPELVRTDTLHRIDTLIVGGNRKDTLFSDRTDTVVLREGRLEVHYYHFHDSVRLEGECKPDTIIRSVPYYVKLINPATFRITGLVRRVLILLAIAAVLLIALRLFTRRR